MVEVLFEDMLLAGQWAEFLLVLILKLQCLLLFVDLSLTGNSFITQFET